MREILLIPEKDIKTYAATDESSYFKKKTISIKMPVFINIYIKSFMLY
jgi:hypothetical protein